MPDAVQADTSPAPETRTGRRQSQQQGGKADYAADESYPVELSTTLVNPAPVMLEWLGGGGCTYCLRGTCTG